MFAQNDPIGALLDLNVSDPSYETSLGYEVEIECDRPEEVKREL